MKFYFIKSKNDVVKADKESEGKDYLCISKSKKIYVLDKCVLNDATGQNEVSLKEITETVDGVVNYAEVLAKYNIDINSFDEFVATAGESPIKEIADISISADEVVKEEVVVITDEKVDEPKVVVEDNSEKLAESELANNKLSEDIKKANEELEVKSNTISRLETELANQKNSFESRMSVMDDYKAIVKSMVEINSRLKNLGLI